MSAAKHTPGPWKAVFDFKCADGDVVPGVVSESTGCAVSWPHGRDEAEAIANARLHAGSLELLEACKFVLEHGFRHKWDGDERAFSMLRAAITKVQGSAS